MKMPERIIAIQTGYVTIDGIVWLEGFENMGNVLTIRFLPHGITIQKGERPTSCGFTVHVREDDAIQNLAVAELFLARGYEEGKPYPFMRIEDTFYEVSFHKAIYKEDDE